MQKRHLWSTLTVLGLILSPLACERESGRCDVEIMQGCAAQCKRKEGNKVCSSALLLSRSASNAILQQESINVVVEDLPGERCFAVDDDGAIADAEQEAALIKACEFALQKADRPMEAPK